MVIKNLCILLLWTKVASALERLMFFKVHALHLSHYQNSVDPDNAIRGALKASMGKDALTHS